MNIARIAIDKPLRRLFDYKIPEEISNSSIQPGKRVSIPFGSRLLVGIVIEVRNNTNIPENKLKFIKSVLDSTPIIDASLLSLCQWASDYYHYPLGEVLFNTIPKTLRINNESKRKKKTEMVLPLISETGINENMIKSIPLILNQEQSDTLQKIINHIDHFKTFLLNGITGSGKTEVYLHLIHQLLSQKKQALVLVPEIALTPQTINRFKDRFNVPIVCVHSGLNDSERFNAWQGAKSGHAKIVIGTRSAIYMPFKNLGTIIVDEEHDLSFKQQEGFRYSARDLAILRANNENIPIILGSATPSFETLYNVEQNRYTMLHLPERAGNAIHPSFHIIDIRDQQLPHGLSKPLLKKIKDHLEQKNQVLLFLNRRGYAPVLMCHQCGWIAMCQRCDIRMTLHQNPFQLRCHHCDSIQQVETICPNCKSANLKDKGIGTERLAFALQKIFPNIPIIRIDRDTTRRKNALTALLDEVNTGEPQILVGTQMISKGHHFPNVTLVGIINTDNAFFSSDFRAQERTGQLLLQVAGRAGRAEKPGEVIIQTHYPDHPLLQQLVHHNYNTFATLGLQERKESNLPPYSYLALIRCESLDTTAPNIFLNNVKAIASPLTKNNISILGPIPAPVVRKKGKQHEQLLLQSNNRIALQDLIRKVIEKIESEKISTKVKWSIDVDPMELF